MAKIYSLRDGVGDPVEIIEDRLYFLSTRTVPQSCPGICHFGVDNDLIYYRFFNDFGPLNIGQTFLRSIESRLWKKGEAEGRYAIPSELRENPDTLELIEETQKAPPLQLQVFEAHPQKIPKPQVKLPTFKSHHTNTNQPVRVSASLSEFSSKKDVHSDYPSNHRRSSKTPSGIQRSVPQTEEANTEKATLPRRPPQLNKHFLDSPYCAGTSNAPNVRPINRNPLASRKGSVPVRPRPRDIDPAVYN